MANILRCEFDSKEDWSPKEVTVYEDRAQVVRVLEYKSTDAGEAELKLTNLPTTLVADSLRAEITSDNATVIAVTSTVVTGEAGEIIVTERETEIDEILATLAAEKRTLHSRSDLLNAYYLNMVPESQPVMKETENTLFHDFSSAENLEAFSNSLSRFMTEMKENSARQLEIVKEERKLNEEKALIISEKYKKSIETAITTSEVSVLINVPENTVGVSPVELKLAYVLTNCCWTATYDMRVNKIDNIVDLSYYGHVTNNSGENWNDIQLYLSTAKPSRGGELPFLPRATVRYRPKKPIFKNKNKIKKKRKEKKQRLFRQAEREEEEEEEEDGDYSDEDDEEEETGSLASSEDDLDRLSEIKLDYIPTIFDPQLQEELTGLTTKNKTVAEDRGGSATFKLNRICSIESDNIPHKQSISQLTLKPRFSYVISPEISPTPYLRCTALNDSNYIFVRGDMNVFFNGSFVTTTELKFVNKKKEFKVFLGKDETVKVGISPQISKKEMKKGNLIASKVNKETFTRKVKIDNTREEDIEIQLLEQLPLARDKKIKVQILSPNMNKKRKKEGYRINFMNHLEVRRILSAGKSWEFTFSYQVEWPKSTDIVYTESLENLAR